MPLFHSVWEKVLPHGKTCLNMDPVLIARVLVILEVVALMVSTSATVIVEALMFLCFIGYATLRQRILRALKQPMVLMALVMYAMVSIGVLYSVAPFSESIDLWGSWRKMLFVPMVASVYADSLWKQRLVTAFMSVATLCALVSCAGYLFGFGNKYGPGILVQNHATQGMLFSVAFFTCLVQLRFPPAPVFIHKRWLIAFAAILLLNIFMVTPGRSGYLAFILLIMVFVYFAVPKKTRLIFLLFTPAVILSLLLASPVARNRILEGVREIDHYEQAPEETSMGVRLVVWKNTIKLLKRLEHPVFGYGTKGFETAYDSLMAEKQITGERKWQDKLIRDPHNQYLRILVEYGSVGLILFFLFIGAFFMQRGKGPFHIMGIGVLLAWCATSLFNAHFTTFAEGRFLLLWCSAMLSASMMSEPERMEA